MAYGNVNVPFVTQAEFDAGIAGVRNDLSKLVGYVPVQAAALTYSGSAKSPTWTDYDTAKLSVGGTTSATNAGNYTATFAPKSGYTWLDGTTAAKSAKWSIEKANGSLSLNKTSVNLSYAAPTATVAVTRAGDGVISVTSSNPAVVAASVSGTTITLVGASTGSATITVKVGEGTNHKAPAVKTITVSAMMVNPDISGCTPKEIQDAARAGLAKNIWSVGDKVPVTFSMFSIGSFLQIYNDVVTYFIIIGFDHNSGIEGNNTVHFQLGHIAFVDYYYGTDSNDGTLKMDREYGGWWGTCTMRTDICKQIYDSIIPEDWKAVIAPCTKYTSHVTTVVGQADADNVKTTSDYIWLLSRYEILGSGNRKENNYQKQYDYFKNGNVEVKYQCGRDGISSEWGNKYASYWTRTMSQEDYYYINSGAGVYKDKSHGLCFGFMVA